MSQEFKQVDRNIMSEATFNAQKSNLPLGAVVDITDGIKMADLDSTLQNTINGKTKLYKHQFTTQYDYQKYLIMRIVSADSTLLTSDNVNEKSAYFISACGIDNDNGLFIYGFMVSSGYDNYFAGWNEMGGERYIKQMTTIITSPTSYTITEL